jgi:hypothetical protein
MKMAAKREQVKLYLHRIKQTKSQETVTRAKGVII